MKLLAMALLTLSCTSVFAEQNLPTYDEKDFRLRFAKADVNKDQKLSREEAYAEFPRIPKYFDEIDANRDNLITIKEVDAAMNRRVNAAMQDGKFGNRYAIPLSDKTNPDSSAYGDHQNDSLYFPDKQAARRYHRNNFYQSLADQNKPDALPAETVDTPQAPPQIIKKF